MSGRAVRFENRSRSHAAQLVIAENSLKQSRKLEDQLRETMRLPRLDDPVYIHANPEIERAEGQLAWQAVNSSYLRSVIEHHDAMRRKYERAARRPWEAIGPDPPEPYWDGAIDDPAPEPRRPAISGRAIDLGDDELDRLLDDLRILEPEHASNRSSRGGSAPIPDPSSPACENG